MKPIDISSYSPGWDCVLSPSNLSTYHRISSQHTSTVAYEKYVFPVAVVIAIAGALLSSDILIALALILAISASARKIYSMLAAGGNAQLHTQLSTDSIIYRHEIEHSADAEALFTRAIDAAVDLKEIVATHSWMSNFADTELINASLWQCAQLLRSKRTRSDHLHVQRTVAELEAAVGYAKESAAALDSEINEHKDTSHVPLKMPTDHHALTISDNMRALRDGTLRINDKMRALDDSARNDVTGDNDSD